MAVLNLNEFVKGFEAIGGPAPLNKFIVTFQPPTAIADVAGNKQLSMLCESTQLPGLNIGTDDGAMPQGFGPAHKMPWGMIFSDIPFTFLADGRGKIHQVLTTWMNNIIPFNVDTISDYSQGVPFFVKYRNNYAAKLLISIYNYTNQQVVTYTLHDAYPKALYPVDASWQQIDGFMRISCVFNYTRWQVSYSDVKQSTTSTISTSSPGQNSTLNTTTPVTPDQANTITTDYSTSDLLVLI